VLVRLIRSFEPGARHQHRDVAVDQKNHRA
jgi:hypothetical protein